MQDEPRPEEILAVAAAFLRAPVTPEGAAHAAFIAKVTANALDIARRDLELSPLEDAAELARLRTLLSIDGDLASLNRELAMRIRDGRIDLSTPGLTKHLWVTTLAKLAVDQPTYASYRAELAARGA
ncbi:DUF6285 domain-containing protein [soil metagenome]